MPEISDPVNWNVDFGGAARRKKDFARIYGRDENYGEIPLPPANLLKKRFYRELWERENPVNIWMWCNPIESEKRELLSEWLLHERSEKCCSIKMQIQLRSSQGCFVGMRSDSQLTSSNCISSAEAAVLEFFKWDFLPLTTEKRSNFWLTELWDGTSAED